MTLAHTDTWTSMPTQACAYAQAPDKQGVSRVMREPKGGAGVLDYGFRLYSPAMARFLSTDPLSPSFPWLTPYQYAENRPIDSRDLDGLERVESVTADGVVNLYGAEVTARKMTAIEINYRSNYRDARNRGYSPASARAYSRIATAGGGDPISRAMMDRMATGMTPLELSGNVTIPAAATGSSDFADGVSQIAYGAISTVITLPLGGGGSAASKGVGMLQAGRRIAGGLKSANSVKSAWQAFRGTSAFARSGAQFLSNEDLLVRGASFVSNVSGQAMSNSATGGSGINLTEAFAAAVAPRNFAFQGAASSVGIFYDPSAARGDEFSADFSLTRGAKNVVIGIGMQHLNRLNGDFGGSGAVLGQSIQTAASGVIDAAAGSLKDVQRP